MKNLLKLLPVLAAVILFWTNTYADDFIKAGNRAAKDTKVSLISSDNNRTVVNVEVNGFYNSNITLDNHNYNNIYLEGYSSIGETGHPTLPMITKYIAIPDNKDVRVEIENAVSTEFSSYEIAPYQTLPMRNTNGTVAGFVKNSAAYSLNAYAPSEIVSIKEIAVMRDYRIAVVSIQPIQYNAADGKIKVYTDIKFSLNYEGTSDVNNAGSTGLKSKVFSNFYKSTIFNYEGDAPVMASPKMLIITNDNLYDGILPFAAWKSSKGIFTTIIKLSDIGSGANPTGQQIKDYLVSRYNTNERPDYVLLVGDAAGSNTVSWFTVGFDKSDHPFTCLAGTDIFPDIALGRISVQSLPELAKAVDKLIQYEKEPNTTQTDWYKRALVIHSFDGIDPVNGQVAKNVFLNEGGFTNVDVQNSNTASQITSSINSGVSWIWFIGHGDPTSWADPYWNMSNMSSLTFGARQPQIISTACANADLDYSTTADGFAEAWIERNQQNSASNIAAYTENCAFYTTDTVGREMLYAYFREDITDFGMMMNYGKVQAYNYFSGNTTVKETIHQLLNLGDPSQVTYSDVPKQLTVSTTQSASSSPTFTVNVKTGTTNIENSLVGISQGNVLKVSGYTDANGNYTFDGASISMGTPLQITVTGKNLIPYQSSVLTSIGGTAEIPTKFELQQNYPNPFNPVTSIKFAVPQSSFVTLKVYDLLGKEVASLVSGNMNAGVYNFNFDASQLTSGVYFYKLTAGDFAEIKKMSLIK